MSYVDEALARIRAEKNAPPPAPSLAQMIAELEYIEMWRVNEHTWYATDAGRDVEARDPESAIRALWETCRERDDGGRTAEQEGRDAGD